MSQSKIVICPPIIFLDAMMSHNKNHDISFGSQDVSMFKKGSYTGEISIDMLENMGCKWVIIGHSERRQMFFETDDTIGKKMQLLQNSSLNPILCIGESLDEKINGLTSEILEKQINSVFSSIDFKTSKDILIAYEPIWAIGTGVAASINIIKENMKLIKKIINNIDTNNCNIYLLYGGSVNKNNASEIFNLNNVNGFLIGSASLDIESFYNIYKQI